MRCCVKIVILFVLYLYKSVTAFTLTGSSTNATVGFQFILTCETSVRPLVFYNDLTLICTINGAHSNGICDFDGTCNTNNYNFVCNTSNTYKLIIPGNLVTESLHGSKWTCKSVFESSKAEYVLQVNVPVSSVTISSKPTDLNPVNVIRGKNQTFACVTSAGRPSAKIQWYLSTSNLTASVTPQPDVCYTDCKDGKVISTSELTYVGDLNDDGQTLHCTAANTDTIDVRSSDKIINILYGPSQINITPSNMSYTVTEKESISPIKCTADCKPNCTITWSGLNLPSGTTSILNLQDIDRNQSGTYQCTANNTVSSMTSNAIRIVVKYGPRHVNITPSTQWYTVVEMGSVVPITCAADCYPNCALTWSGPNLLALADPILNLQNIDRSQSGNYNCTAKNEISDMASVDVFIIVNYGPRNVKITPPTSLYTRNESLESLGPITCKAECKPDCNYTWSGPNFYFSATDVLNFIQINRNQTGNYSCTAKNSVSSWTSSVFRLVVYYIPTIIEINKNKTLSENSTLVVTCKVESNPLSNVWWMFENTLLGTEEPFNISNKLQETYVESTLTVRQIRCLSMGIYRCMGNNMLGETNSSMYVSVKCSPRIHCPECLRQVIPIKGKEVINITVPIIAFPKPTMFWRFVQNESSVNASGETINYGIANKYFSTFLKINVTDKDFGLYRVYAYNGEGNTTDFLYSFEVISQRAPYPPGNITCDGRINSVVLSWQSEFNGGSDQIFTVYYKKSSIFRENTNWISYKNYSDPGQQKYTTDEIQPLQSGTSYIFTVHAVNLNNYTGSDHAFCNTSKEEPNALNQSSALTGGLAGLGAAICILVLVGVVVYLVKSRRSRKHGKDTEPINRPHTSADNYNDELRDNPTYVSASIIVNENNKVEYSVVKKDFVPKQLNDPSAGRGTSAVSQTPKSGNKRKSTGITSKNARKDMKNRHIEMGCVYENGGDIIAARRKDINQKADINNTSEGPYQPKMNKDGLVYADLDLATVSAGKRFVIRGSENRKNYAIIDLSKKADPLPDTDSDEEENPSVDSQNLDD